MPPSPLYTPIHPHTHTHTVLIRLHVQRVYLLPWTDLLCHWWTQPVVTWAYHQWRVIPHCSSYSTDYYLIHHIKYWLYSNATQNLVFLHPTQISLGAWSRARVSFGQCRLSCLWKHFRKHFCDVPHCCTCVHFMKLLKLLNLIWKINKELIKLLAKPWTIPSKTRPTPTPKIHSPDYSFRVIMI